ncbi:MAG TPA: hypothetical protein VFZ69_15315 [Longimicrobiales bacterium]
MKRLVLMAAVAGTATLAACGGGDVVVQAYHQPEGGQPTAITDLPVRALPYDRDVMFDSLATAYGTPEPEIPADLAALRDSINAAQQQWSTMNARWGTARDSLLSIRQQMDRIGNRASGQYVALFRLFTTMEGQERSSKQASDQAFNRFQSLQSRYNTRAEEIRLAREQWADAAYADIDRIRTARLRELRLEEAADTTDESGVAVFRGLRAGQWWIHARYDLPFEELYWNVPIDVTGEGQQIQLTRENAQVRPKL